MQRPKEKRSLLVSALAVLAILIVTTPAIALQSHQTQTLPEEILPPTQTLYPESPLPKSPYLQNIQKSLLSFTVPEITILNPKSLPFTGGLWTVNFETGGKADLRIRGVDGTEFGKELEFLELKCGQQTVPTEWNGEWLVAKNFECDEIASETSTALLEGKHRLEFVFGKCVKYAYNSTITLVQDKTNAHAYRAPSTSLTTTLDAGATAGNLIVTGIAIDKASGTITQPADFTLIQKGEGGISSGAMAYKISTGGETGITWSWAANEEGSGWVGEYSGLVSTGVLDVSVENESYLSTATNTISTGTTAGTAQADELAIALFAADSGNSVGATRTWTNGFAIVAEETTTSGSPFICIASKTLTLAGTVESTVSHSGNDECYAMVATFKAAAAGNAPDANVQYPMNGESFDKDYVSTIDVNIAVFDPDTNTFDMTIDINYSNSQTQGTGISIISDTNLATLNCDSNDLSTSPKCKYAWTITNITNGNYYILTKVTDSAGTDFNAGADTFTITSSSAMPDINVSYPEAGEIFDRTVLSTIDINVSVQDSDTNTFDMNIDINYSTSQTQGGGTVIINDVNLATLNCDSNNLKTVQQCKYTWTITGLTNGDYYILAEVTDGKSFDFNAGESTFTITTPSPDANVSYPMSGESFDKASVSTIDINISVQDSDTNAFDLNIDINYSSSQTQGTGTAIINDINLATLRCDSNALDTAQVCTYTWTITDITNDNYYILTEVSDPLGNTDFNSGASTFTITNSSSSSWTAYNDCGNSIANSGSTGNVTNVGLTEGSGTLVKYSDGSSTGVTFSISGGTGEGIGAESTYWGPPVYPPAGDARTEFNPNDNNLLNVGSISYGNTGTTITTTLTGLDNTKTYTLVYLGMRGEYTDRWSRYTISDVSSFTNESSSGTTITTVTTANDATTYLAGENFDNGYVAKWTGVDPGADGDITVTIIGVAYGGDAANKPYLSAVKVTEEVSGSTPDANVLYPSGQTFNKANVSTIDINISISDQDTNAINMTIDLNYSNSQTQGTGTSIINDYNMANMTCDSNDFSQPRECKYSWDISGIANGNYYILSGASDGSFTDFNAGNIDFNLWDSTPVYTPDANMVYPMSGESFDKASVSTIDINISVQDSDTNAFDLNIDINYSSSQTQGTGTAIINDINLATLRCDSNALDTAQVCTYTWTITDITNDNYYILTEVSDPLGNTDFNSGASTFTITNSSSSSWTAYNDCGNSIANSGSTGNVTNVGLTEGSGTLVKYSDGSSTGVTFSISGGTGEGIGAESTYWGPPVYPPAGDARTEFNPNDNNLLNVGSISYGNTGTTITTTLTGLDNTKTYTLVYLGMRGEYTDRWSRYTISDVSSFTNESSSGTTITTVTTANDATTYLAGENFDNGYVAKWTGVDPGADGDITVTIIGVAYGGDAANKPYLSAVKVTEEVSGSTPDANVLYPSGQTFNKANVSTIDINISISDQDTNAINMTIDLNYSNSQTQGTGTSIINDYNMANMTCDSNDFSQPRECKYSWDISGIANGNYYILSGASDGSFTDFNAGNIDFNLWDSTPVYTPDANMVYPISGQSFDRASVSTIDINTSISDKDTNASNITIDLNYSNSQTQGTGTSIIDDTNLATLTCGSNDLSTAQECKYSWNIENAADGTYYILTEASDGVRTDFNSGNATFTITCSNQAPDANVLYPVLGHRFDKENASTIDININIYDPDTNANDINIDINYSTTQTQGTGTAIINDQNMGYLTCDSNDFSTAQECKYTWTITGISDGNYYILIEASDGYNHDFNAGTGDFEVWDSEPVTAGTVIVMCDGRPGLSASDGEALLANDLNQIDDQMPGDWNADAFLHTGDMDYLVYSGGQNLTDAIASSEVAGIPVFHTIGNHELDNAYDLQAAKDAFDNNYLDWNLKPGPTNGTKSTYSFDVGEMHIAVLNEYFDGTDEEGTDGDVVTALFDWLKTDLRNSTKAYKFVSGHEAAYPRIRHKGDSLDAHPDNLARFWNLLQTESVVGYLTGHDHYSAVEQFDGIFEIDAGVSGRQVGTGENFATIIYLHNDVNGLAIRKANESAALGWASPTITTTVWGDINKQVLVNTHERAGTQGRYWVDYDTTVDDPNPDWSANNSGKWWDPDFNAITEDWNSGELCVGYDSASPASWGWINTDINYDPNNSGDEHVHGIFQRTSFDVHDRNRYKRMHLEVDYDDALTIWLNGTKIYESATSPAFDDTNYAANFDMLATGQRDPSGDMALVPSYTQVDVTQYMRALVDSNNTLAIANWNRETGSTDLVAAVRLYIKHGPALPDTNVLYPISGQSFDRATVSTVDINISIADDDTNAAGMTIDLNYSPSQTQGTGTAIINDTNMGNLTCDSNDFSSPQECKYTWNITAVANGTYYILIEANDGANTDFNSGNSTFAITSSNTGPDANVLYPLSGQSFDRSGVSTVDINISIYDGDTNANDLNIDINYSTAQTQGGGTVIINDTNMGTLTCDSNDLSTVRECKYSWDISSVSDGTYYILSEVSDGGNQDFNAATGTFTIISSAPMITIIEPVNGTQDTNYFMNLNIEVGEPEGDDMNIAIYGASNIADLNNSLLYWLETSDDNVTIDYNWNAPVVIPTSDTVLLFHFDKRQDMGETDTVVYDFAGGNHNGTAGNPISSMGGKFGGFAAFPVALNPVTVLHDAAIDFGVDENFTVMFWFRTSQNNTNGTELLEKQDGGVFWQIRGPESDQTDKIKIQLDDGTDPQTVVQSNTTELDDNVWHHVAIVRYYDDNVSMYIDGAFDNSGADVAESVAGTTNLLIGGGSQGDHYSGDLDEVSIWTRPLGGEEIASYYQLDYNTYYWDVNAQDGSDNNDSSGTIDFVLQGSVSVGVPDANAVYPMAGQSFDRITVSTVDINISVYDSDNNANDLNIDINYSTSQTQGTGTAIVNDQNMGYLTCDSNDLSTAQECKYSWNITSILNGDYYILIETTDQNGNTDFNSSNATFTITSSSGNPDVNVLYPVIGGFDGYNGTIDINVNIFDSSTNATDMTIDINYSTSQTQGTGTVIVNDYNMANMACDSNDFSTAQECKYSWDISSVPDGNYYILVEASDGGATDFNSGNTDFNIWNSGPWLYKMKLTFKNIVQDENLLDFPVMVKLTQDRVNYSDIDSNGNDLVFTDSNGMKLSYEMEGDWNADGNNILWVRAVRIEEQSNTDFMYMYYGKEGASRDEDAENVWVNNYAAVYHFAEQTGNYLDSTSNNNDSNNVKVQSRDNTDANGLGYYPEFGGYTPADHVAVPDDATLNFGTGDFTIMARANASSTTTDADLTRKGSTGVAENSWWKIEWGEGAANRVNYLYRVNGADVANTLVFAPDNHWHDFWGTRDTGNNRSELFIDGETRGNSVSNNGSVSSSANVGIGSKDTYNDDHFQGFMDEVRYASAARSAHWIRAQHYSLDDNFLIFSSVPDMNILTLNGSNDNLPNMVSYANDVNVTVRFYVFDSDGEDLNFNMWYGSTQGTKTTLLVSDVNLDDDECVADMNGVMGNYCSWDWNLSGVSDGNHFVTVEINDGITSDSNSTDYSLGILVDNSGPSTTSDANSGWQSTDANVYLTCTDSTRCSTTAIRIDTDTSSTASYSAWITGDASDLNAYFSTDGNWGVDFNSIDIMENVETINKAFVLIDSTAPAATISSPTTGANQYSTTVTLIYSGSDATSGIASYSVKADSGSWIANGTSTTYSFTGQSITSHTYYVKAEDAAGNESSSDSVTFSIIALPTDDDTPIVRPDGSGGDTGTPAYPPTDGTEDGEGTGGESGTIEPEIVRFDGEVKKGDIFDFMYLLKNPFDYPIEIEVMYWLEKGREKILSGSERVALEAEEERGISAALNLDESMLGEYIFVFRALYNGKETVISNDVRIAEFVPLNLDISISRLPPTIGTEPTTLMLTVGSNYDDRIKVRLNQVILKGNEIVWNNSQDLSIKAAKRFEQMFPSLEPGEYTWVLTVASGESMEKITRTIIVKEKAKEPIPGIAEVLIQENGILVYGIVGIILIIAAIVSWHYLVVARYFGPEDELRAKVKIIYLIAFIAAVIIILGFAVYSMMDVLGPAIGQTASKSLWNLANDPQIKTLIEVVRGRLAGMGITV